MKKLQLGMVIDDDGEKYMVLSHKGDHIKVLNDSGKEIFLSESVVKRSMVLEGADAMAVVKEVFYGK